MTHETQQTRIPIHRYEMWYQITLAGLLIEIVK